MPSLNVMRSSGISWNSYMWQFHFSIWLKCSLGECTFCWKPRLNQSSGCEIMSIWRILRTLENNRNSFLFLAISHNQCCRLPTDPARSQRVLIRLCYMNIFVRMPIGAVMFVSPIACMYDTQNKPPMYVVSTLVVQHSWQWWNKPTLFISNLPFLPFTPKLSNPPFCKHG